jgi:uncharacterized protein YxjI
MAEQSQSAGALPPPAAPGPTRDRSPRRPAFWLIVALAVVGRFGRSFLPVWAALSSSVAIGVLAIGWRLAVRRRARRTGSAELDPEQVRAQIAKSGVAAPAFAEDGSLLGSSVLVVNQRSKLIEVITEYEIFDSQGHTIGHVRQIGQGRFKKFLRFVTAFDQLMTHHFDVTDRAGRVVLRVTRPRKWFRSRLEVFDGNDRFLGRIVQQNVFGKINFGLHDPNGALLATLHAENWRAWDFRVDLATGIEVARITKSWEGLLRTAFTNADHYVLRIHQVLGEPFRSLVFATALTVDLALKQDPRGFAG